MGLFIILVAWFVEMPLWLSIIMTIFGSLKLITAAITFISKYKKLKREKALSAQMRWKGR